MIGAPSGDAAVEIEGLTISYRSEERSLRVLSDVSLSIRRGGSYGLVGESGCGKTTLAMALMRSLPANTVIESGRISFDGENLLRSSERRLRHLWGNRMAMVSQDPGTALNPSMQVGKQIAEVYRHHKSMDRREATEAARMMLEKVQIADPTSVLRRYPHQLSGGQQQRVMIAMALATDPDLLVLDEPTTGLDATVEADVLELVAELRKEFHTAILYISHNLGIVARMCERVGILYAGEIVEEGPAAQLFSAPRHPYTRALLQCVPHAGASKAKQQLESIPGSMPALGTRVTGCVYAPRCPIARDRCRSEPPPLLDIGSGRFTRCFFHAEVPHQLASLPLVAVPKDTLKQDALLRVDHLVKTYRAGRTHITVVSDVSFEVRRGEVFALVGESGSGKSTLAKCVVGLLQATGGDIEFDGVKVGVEDLHDRDLRRSLQMIFQNPDSALNPSHPVKRILGRALKLLADTRTRGERERRMLSLAASVKLDPRHLNARPATLSGGLKQRVAIAHALAGSPALLLCDEPTSALDVSVQAAILRLLSDLQSTHHVSYILISHDLAVVRYIADRVGVMYLGQLVEVGPIDAVFAPPHHPYTEALLSAMPNVYASDDAVRIRVSGAIPSVSNPPSGCRFHTRCPRYLGDICRVKEPPWQRNEAGHEYRCHIRPEELQKLQTHEQNMDRVPTA